MRVIILVGLLLAASMAVAQDDPYHPVISLPDIEFNVQDVIGVLSDYNVISEDNPTFCSQYYGLTDFQSRTISICARMDQSLKKRTLIHEVLHVLYWNRGIQTSGSADLAVQIKATEIFMKLYGEK